MHTPAENPQQNPPRYYFPPPGHGLSTQQRQDPAALGFTPEIKARLAEYLHAHRDSRVTTDQRWALWRHGYLAEVAGDFTAVEDVYSLRKTWHAMTVGAAWGQGRIPSLDQPLGEWLPDLPPRHAGATWRHVLTQSSGYDYPHGDHPAYLPGVMWTYSDWNLVRLGHALARVYGRRDFYDDYDRVLKAAYFDAVGMEGWSTVIKYDPLSGMEDGVRLVLSLEHMGRLGLLVLARGTWDGTELVPRRFVEALETKQTQGMQVNYDGPYDGKIGLDPAQFPEAPYGFLTWVNTDGDLYPGADRAWACGRGAGGMIVLWNHRNGVVFAGVGVENQPGREDLPHLIERNIAGPNPLVDEAN